MAMNNRQSARDYLQRRWSVIPIHARDKRPANLWQEFQHRLATVDEIEEWFRRWPDANVGIVTGALSGIVVLDIDSKHGGEESLQQWVERHGPLPHTVEAITGGGRHLYFVHPGGIVRNRVGLARGIDLRGDGGCVVAPPSLHASGKHYHWRAGHEPQHIAPAALPGWLREMLGGSRAGRGHPLEHWRHLVREGVDEGERNNTIASFTGHLLWHGVDLGVVEELLLCWNRVRCRPPLDDEEVVRTVESIGRLHEQQVDEG
jgi:hypothetical protein